MPDCGSESRRIVWFSEVGLADVPLVGGKNAALGEMIQSLTDLGIRVPNGFCVTTSAFEEFLSGGGLDALIETHLSEDRLLAIEAIQSKGRLIREAFLATPVPEALSGEICQAYRTLCGSSPEPIKVAVRSSATLEDSIDASFAGQQETYLNISGEEDLIRATRACFASLYTDRAITYRRDRWFSQTQVLISVAVQQMVRSDLASAGVMFTLDTESGFREAILINAAYGLGEEVVSGSVDPDEYLVFKPMLREGYRPIIRRRSGAGSRSVVTLEAGGSLPEVTQKKDAQASCFCLKDDEILLLSRWACLIEAHFSQRYGQPTPMDIEWAKDGITDLMYVVQARPETVHGRAPPKALEIARIERPLAAPLLKGRSIGAQVASGPVHQIRQIEDLPAFRAGEVLVAAKTDPDWEPAMKMAAAIITDTGGRTCHAAIVSRELGIPAVVGTGTATSVLKEGAWVTVCCAEGDTGLVYAGRVPYRTERVDLADLPRPKTRLMLNVGNPEQALRLSFLPCDGVGLARLEFIIADAIGIHPEALLHPDQIDDPEVRHEIEHRVRGYPHPADFYVDRLAEGIGTIAAAFYPREVIVRASDFKSNEYASLLGGRWFEPREENPMLGFRGASRYYDAAFRDAFALEARAVLRVRQDMGLQNLQLMIPFVRTVEEAERVIFELKTHGLVRGEEGLALYVMCEIPSNLFQVEELAHWFDGFSIGSNDLTQLILGIDRDSSRLAALYDERHPVVLGAILEVIAKVKATGRKIGICGQAPSDYPEFMEALVKAGIDSISLSPDALVPALKRVAEMEATLSGTSPL